MTKTDLPVLGIGRAYIDVNARIDFDFLHSHGLTRSATTALTDERFDQLLSLVPDPWMCTGGCVANTVASLADGGIGCGLVCAVGQDPWGRAFVADFERRGVRLYPSSTGTGGGNRRSGRCLVLVTPDGEPTFAINPGVADEFPSGPLKEWPDQPSYLLLEGNLLYRRAHFESLIALLSAFGGESTRLRKILTLHACTDMSPEGMMICCEALPKFDFILGNKAEMLAFGPAIEDRRRDAADWRPVLLSTLGPEGVTIEDVAGVRKISAAVPPRVVDAVGAGDAFLGGLIYGLLRDGPVEHAVECGIQWATRKLSEAGSRPRLSELSV